MSSVDNLSADLLIDEARHGRFERLSTYRLTARSKKDVRRVEPLEIAAFCFGSESDLGSGLSSISLDKLRGPSSVISFIAASLLAGRKNDAVEGLDVLLSLEEAGPQPSRQFWSVVFYTALIGDAAHHRRLLHIVSGITMHPRLALGCSIAFIAKSLGSETTPFLCKLAIAAVVSHDSSQAILRALSGGVKKANFVQYSRAGSGHYQFVLKDNSVVSVEAPRGGVPALVGSATVKDQAGMVPPLVIYFGYPRLFDFIQDLASLLLFVRIWIAASPSGKRLTIVQKKNELFSCISDWLTRDELARVNLVDEAKLSGWRDSCRPSVFRRDFAKDAMGEGAAIAELRRRLRSEGLLSRFDKVAKSRFTLILNLELEKRIWLEQDTGLRYVIDRLREALPQSCGLDIIINGITAYRGGVIDSGFDEVLEKEMAFYHSLESDYAGVQLIQIRNAFGCDLRSKIELFSDADLFIGPIGSGTCIQSLLLGLPGVLYGPREFFDKAEPHRTRGTEVVFIDLEHVTTLPRGLGSGRKISTSGQTTWTLSYSFSGETLWSAVGQRLGLTCP